MGLLLWTCVALCATLLRGVAAGNRTTEMILVKYDLQRFPYAVCNDGTAGGFYLAPATDPKRSKIWVILLEGGQWCWDAQSCGIRSQQNPALTTSSIWPPHMSQTGIFNADPRRNAFAGANLVYAGYCSSDAWVGNAGAESNAFGWAFRGQHHVEALIATLTEPCPVVVETRIHFANHTHLDVNTTYTAEPLGAGSRLLFSGCSAGARGAMFNIDYVAAMLPPGVELRGFFDSPLWVDVLPFESNITSLENETQTILPLINATSRLSAACAAMYPGDQAWKCLFGQYRVPFVTTPYLMSASQFDRYQLPWNEGTMPPYVGSALTYANAFQKAVRSVVLDLPTISQPGSAIYSSACFRHCVTMIGAYWGVKVNGMSLNDYVAMWYFGSTDPDAHVNPQDGGQSGTALPLGLSDQHIEACNGFGCGECHSKTARPAPPLPPAYATSLIPGVAPTRAPLPAGAPQLLHIHTALAAPHKVSMRHTAIAVGGGLGAAAVLLLGVCLVGQRAKHAATVRATTMGPGSVQAQRARETSPLLQRTGGSAARPAAAAKSKTSSAAAAVAGTAREPAPRTAQPPVPPRGAMRTAKPAQFGL